MDFKNKYLKYKKKYLDLKVIIGGNTPYDTDTIIKSIKTQNENLLEKGIIFISKNQYTDLYKLLVTDLWIRLEKCEIINLEDLENKMLLIIDLFNLLKKNNNTLKNKTETKYSINEAEEREDYIKQKDGSVEQNVEAFKKYQLGKEINKNRFNTTINNLDGYLESINKSYKKIIKPLIEKWLDKEENKNLQKIRHLFTFAHNDADLVKYIIEHKNVKSVFVKNEFGDCKYEKLYSINLLYVKNRYYVQNDTDENKQKKLIKYLQEEYDKFIAEYKKFLSCKKQLVGLTCELIINGIKADNHDTISTKGTFGTLTYKKLEEIDKGIWLEFINNNNTIYPTQ
uniref:Uncharacterized protein n=1 Tax=viral metagenome TaxID=1070528 RepID=A0A6C0DBD2_9ZZZZ